VKPRRGGADRRPCRRLRRAPAHCRGLSPHRRGRPRPFPGADGRPDRRWTGGLADPGRRHQVARPAGLPRGPGEANDSAAGVDRPFDADQHGPGGCRGATRCPVGSRSGGSRLFRSSVGAQGVRTGAGLLGRWRCSDASERRALPIRGPRWSVTKSRWRRSFKGSTRSSADRRDARRGPLHGHRENGRAALAPAGAGELRLAYSLWRRSWLGVALRLGGAGLPLGAAGSPRSRRTRSPIPVGSFASSAALASLSCPPVTW
jgi:hypothetical protein